MWHNDGRNTIEWQGSFKTRDTSIDRLTVSQQNAQSSGAIKDGELWYDPTQRGFIGKNNGMLHGQTSFIFASGSAGTAVTSRAELTLLSFDNTSRGSKVLPDSFMQTGNVLRFRAWGLLSSQTVSMANLTLKLKKGSTILAKTASMAIPASLSNSFWRMDASMHAQTPTRWRLNTAFEYVAGTSGAMVVYPMTNTSFINAGSTTEEIDLTAQWGLTGSGGAQSIACHQFEVEAGYAKTPS